METQDIIIGRIFFTSACIFQDKEDAEKLLNDDEFTHPIEMSDGTYSMPHMLNNYDVDIKTIRVNQICLNPIERYDISSIVEKWKAFNKESINKKMRQYD